MWIEIIAIGLFLFILAGLFFTPLFDNLFDWGVDIPEKMEEDIEE
jgi:hypothetical protein